MILITAHGAPRKGKHGTTYTPTLHLHPGCTEANLCDEPDTIAVNILDEAYAIMRALKSAKRHDSDQGRYVRNRIKSFTVTGGDYGDRVGEYTRADVDALPVLRGCPDHPEYGVWRADVIENAPAGHKAVTEARLISPALARAVGIKGVHLWDADRPKQEPNPERVNHTTAAELDKGEPVYVRTLPERHPVHPGKTVADVFGHDGYWFTLPGDLMPETPTTRRTFAVYQAPDLVPGGLVWTVAGTGGGVESARNIATSTETRRSAVRGAVAVVILRRWEKAKREQEQAAGAGVPVDDAVRLSITEAGWWAVHVRCACVIADGDVMATGKTPGDVAEFLEGDAAPWNLCVQGDGAAYRDASGRMLGIVSAAERDESGRPVVVIASEDDGVKPWRVRLSSMGAHSL